MGCGNLPAKWVGGGGMDIPDTHLTILRKDWLPRALIKQSERAAFSTNWMQNPVKLHRGIRLSSRAHVFLWCSDAERLFTYLCCACALGNISCGNKMFLRSTRSAVCFSKGRGGGEGVMKQELRDKIKFLHLCPPPPPLCMRVTAFALVLLTIPIKDTPV